MLSKRDLVPDDGRGRRGRRSGASGSAATRSGVLAVSSATGAGIEELRRAIFAAVPAGRSRAAPRRRPRSRSSRPSTSSTGRPASRASTSSARTTARSASAGAASSCWSRRHDLANPEALAYLEQRLREIGVLAALCDRPASSPATRCGSASGRSSSPGWAASCRYLHLRRDDRRRQARLLDRRRRRRRAALGRARQRLRAGRRAARGRRERRARHLGRDRARDAADGAGRARPRAIDELQAASAVGQGSLFRAYEERLGGRGRPRRPGAADLVRHVGADALPERAPDAAAAARLARGAGRERERHHGDRRDHVRRQRLPLRPGGDPARGAAARPAHRHGGPAHGRPARATRTPS